jgi:AcrR family transcriptional regulator
MKDAPEVAWPLSMALAAIGVCATAHVAHHGVARGPQKRLGDPPITRDRVVAEASRLFATRGFAATSIADLAEASGLLKGNLADCFKTKKDLRDAVVDARARRFGLIGSNPHRKAKTREQRSPRADRCPHRI